MSADFEYIKRTYRVPAEIGRRVVVHGKPGIIAADRGHYLGVNFDADKPGVIKNAHPTSEVVYLEMGLQDALEAYRKNEPFHAPECAETPVLKPINQ